MSRLSMIPILVAMLILSGGVVRAADGDLVVNGNLCVGGNCTNTLHVSGGLYGRCFNGGFGLSTCDQIIAPAICVPNPYNIYGQLCGCPSGYTSVLTGTYVTPGVSGGVRIQGNYHSCLKN